MDAPGFSRRTWNMAWENPSGVMKSIAVPPYSTSRAAQTLPSWKLGGGNCLLSMIPFFGHESNLGSSTRLAVPGVDHIFFWVDDFHPPPFACLQSKISDPLWVFFFKYIRYFKMLPKPNITIIVVVCGFFPNRPFLNLTTCDGSLPCK